MRTFIINNFSFDCKKQEVDTFGVERKQLQFYSELPFLDMY